MENENNSYSYLTPIFGSLWPHGRRIFEVEKEETTRKFLADRLLKDSITILDICSKSLLLFKRGYYEFTQKLLYSGNGDKEVPNITFGIDKDFFIMLVDSIGNIFLALDKRDYQTLNSMYELVERLGASDIFNIAQNKVPVSTFFRDKTYDEHRECFETIIADADAIELLDQAGNHLRGVYVEDNPDIFQGILMVHRLVVIIGAIIEYITFQWNTVMGEDSTESDFESSELYKCLENSFEGGNYDNDDDGDNNSSYSSSTEAAPQTPNNSPQKNPVDDDKTVDQRGDEASQEEFEKDNASIDKTALKLNQKAKLLMNKILGKEGFFKKYIGRIDGLLEHYGDEATVKENKLNGDPVKTLMGPAKDYITSLADAGNKIFQELQNTLNGIGMATDPDSQIKIANNYMKVDLKKTKKISDAFYSAFMSRIANAIIPNDHKVYGYTRESIVMNGKVPPPNHMIVSFFVANAHEGLEDIPVNQVFESAQSFQIMENAQQIPVMELVNNIKSKINNIANNNFYNAFKNMKKKSLSSIEVHKSNNSFANADTEKSAKRLVEGIWKAAKHSVSKLLTFKSYVLQCCDSYMNMVDRVDTLARQCMGSLLEAEKKATDARYHKSGFGVASTAKINKLSQNVGYQQKGASTKGEKILGSAQGMLQNKSFSKSARQQGIHNIATNTPSERENQNSQRESPEERNQRIQEWKQAVQNAKDKIKGKKKIGG